MSQAPGQLIPVNRCSLPTLSPHGSWFHDGPHHRCIAAVAPRRAGSARYPYPFWLGRAPAHSGWTEPPGRLPSCTRLPFTLPLGRCLRLSSPKRFPSERLYPHGSQSALWASLRAYAVAAPRRTQVCTQPLLVGIEQNLLAAILASTRFPPPLCLGGSAFQRVLPRVPTLPPLILTDPRLARASLQFFAGVALRVPGMHATPVLCGRTEPPGRLPSSARIPLEVVGLPRLSPRLSGF